MLKDMRCPAASDSEYIHDTNTQQTTDKTNNDYSNSDFKDL